MTQFINLVEEVRSCRLCEADLPCGPRPVLQVSQHARIMIAGQAPGRKVHESGIPFDDSSGERLRSWLGADKDTFYDENKMAILPMGFCYPGTGKQGDLPPRKECAQTWRQALLDLMPNIELTILIGRYAIDWHLPEYKKQSLNKAIEQTKDDWDKYVLLPHPSPRNNIWLKKHPWFEEELVPKLRGRVSQLLNL